MTDTKNDAGKDSPLGEPQAGKRPYATLDLKATEIKVTSILDKSQATVRAAASATPEPTPGPAPASTYASASAKPSATIGDGSTRELKPELKASSMASASASAATETKPAAASASAAKATATQPEKVIIKKRGGFFSHAAAGLFGGILALAGSEWALPQLGIYGTTSRLADNTSAIDQRLQALEKKSLGGDNAAAFAATDSRLAELEKTAQQIPALTDAQTRLVAETKAALASAASDAGAPDQFERLVKIENQLKTLADAGVNDPNSGRLAQLAALTGKVSDLETSLATQLTALRKSVAEDVEGRITSATEASEAAKAGTQRIDKDVAGVKTDSIKVTERLQSLKTESDRLSETIKMAQEETASLKSAVETLKINAAKPADIAAAVGPIAQKISTLEQSIQAIIKSEDDRRSNGERVVLSLELQNLKRALDRGQKFDAELADVQKTAGSKLDLSALVKFKDQGVPAVAELGKDFRSAATAAIDADTMPPEGSVVDRLIAGAKSVVRVRQVKHEANDKSTEAIVGRMEVALKEARLDDVLVEAQGLPAKSQDAARPFLDKVSARVSVDQAVASIENQLKTSLSAAPPPAPKATP